MSSAAPVFDGKPTAVNLKMIGNSWQLMMKNEGGGKLSVSEEAKKIIAKALLEVCGFKVYTVWQKNDPFVVKAGSRGLAYKTIMHAAIKDDAKQFGNWMDGSCDFDSLSHAMQNLAVITHVAEVGRGYGQSELNKLRKLMTDIVAGDDSWANFKERYNAAYTAKEDTDYDPTNE